jgi:hypothetical protein
LFIVCIDLTQTASHKLATATYLKDIATLARQSTVGPFKTILVGTKSDKGRAVAYEECMALSCSEDNCMYFEHSQHNPDNFQKVLRNLLEQTLEEAFFPEL